MTRTELRDAIRADLLEQLERNGTVGKYYTDMVDDYMTMWDVKNQLADDLAENGAVRERHYANGTVAMENSKSTDQLLKVNAQMLKLLENIGIGLAQVEGDDDDEL